MQAAPIFMTSIAPSSMQSDIVGSAYACKWAIMKQRGMMCYVIKHLLVHSLIKYTGMDDSNISVLLELFVMM